MLKKLFLTMAALAALSVGFVSCSGGNLMPPLVDTYLVGNEYTGAMGPMTVEISFTSNTELVWHTTGTISGRSVDTTSYYTYSATDDANKTITTKNWTHSDAETPADTSADPISTFVITLTDDGFTLAMPGSSYGSQTLTFTKKTE